MCFILRDNILCPICEDIVSLRRRDKIHCGRREADCTGENSEYRLNKEKIGSERCKECLRIASEEGEESGFDIMDLRSVLDKPVPSVEHDKHDKTIHIPIKQARKEIRKKPTRPRRPQTTVRQQNARQDIEKQRHADVLMALGETEDEKHAQEAMELIAKDERLARAEGRQMERLSTQNRWEGLKTPPFGKPRQG
jgi:hypothetical protein